VAYFCLFVHFSAIPCDVCGANVSFMEFETHLKTHKKPKPQASDEIIPCDVCKATFPISFYQEHFEAHREDKKKKVCKIESWQWQCAQNTIILYLYVRVGVCLFAPQKERTQPLSSLSCPCNWAHTTTHVVQTGHRITNFSAPQPHRSI
jgi:hypothetical protein